MSHYMNSAKAAGQLDRLIITGLIAAFGITNPNRVSAFEGGTSFVVDTDVGKLRGRVYVSDRLTDSGNKWSPGWVHFRFDDVNLAKTVLLSDSAARLNGYSGKWNFMFDGQTDLQVSDVARMVAEIKELNPRNFALMGGRP